MEIQAEWSLWQAVTDLDGTDMFLGHDWLVKHNHEVNWKNGTIKFTRCPGNCTMTYKDICQDRGRWTLFYFRLSFFILLFFSFFSFKFLFLEQLGLGFISHAVTSVTNWWRNHKTNHEMWENEVEGSRTSNVIQHGHHMLASCITHGRLG